MLKFVAGFQICFGDRAVIQMRQRNCALGLGAFSWVSVSSFRKVPPCGWTVFSSWATPAGWLSPPPGGVCVAGTCSLLVSVFSSVK